MRTYRVGANRIAAFLLATLAVATSLRPAFAEDAESDAAYWLGLERGGRFAYVHGFFAGAGHGSRTTSLFWAEAGYIKKRPSPADFDRLWKQVLPRTPGLIFPLVDGITELYKDPLNAFVATDDALLITVNRLQGLDVEKQLREARRFGLEMRQKSEPAK